MVNLLIIFTLIFSSRISFALSDIEMINQARQSYALNNFKKAIEVYSQIKPQSDFWIESIEERAWAWTRLNQYENALADLQSITSPIWSSQVGPEAYVLNAFISLKMCNYKEVVAKINLFKKRMLVRVEALEKIETQKKSLDLKILANQIKNNQLSSLELGKSAELYPHYFFRDLALIQALQNKQFSLASQRLKELAKSDLLEIKNNLKKMKIIEVELMQNVLTQNSIETSNHQLEFSHINPQSQISFPVTDDEVWLDEVGQFQVKAPTCPYRKVSQL